MAANISRVQSPRNAKRVRVLMTGTVFTPDGARSVRVQDLSATGALVVSDASLAAGCDAIFKKGPIFAAARVAWSADYQAGLRFYRELTQSEIDSAFRSSAAEAT